MFNLPVHYTLGRGLAEELGEDLLDIAVFTAFREAAKVGNQSDLNRHEFDFRGLHYHISEELRNFWIFSR